MQTNDLYNGREAEVIAQVCATTSNLAIDFLRCNHSLVTAIRIPKQN